MPLVDLVCVDAVVAGLGIMTQTELPLVLLGGIFVVAAACSATGFTLYQQSIA